MANDFTNYAGRICLQWFAPDAGPDRSRPHDTDSPACWCGPRVLQACPVCLSSDCRNPECFECNGAGLVEPYSDQLDSFVVHVDRKPPTDD